MNPKVSAVVLAHDNYKDTAECLASLLNSEYCELSIWLVDNGSSDGTAWKAAKDFPMVHIVQTGRNLGVAGGFNAGIIHAIYSGADYIFLLNNDVVVERGAIRELVAQGISDKKIGILMPKILYYHNKNIIWSAGARYRLFPPSIVMIGLNRPDGPTYNIPCDLEYAPTCGLLISRVLFEKIGLFDDGYFFYYDDWDYCLRARRAGYIIRYVPSARLYHKVSLTIRSYKRSPEFWRIWGRSGGRFYRRNGRPPWLSAFIHLGYIALREGIMNGINPMINFIIGAVYGYFKEYN